MAVRAGMPKSLNGKPTSLINVGTDICLVDTPSDIFCYTARPQSPYAAAFVTANPLPDPQDTSSPIASPPPVSGDSFETLLESYVSATERQDDPNARMQRCRIGATLVREHAGALDSELQGLILEQLKQDGCYG